jgi:hypothetical protein
MLRAVDLVDLRVDLAIVNLLRVRVVIESGVTCGTICTLNENGVQSIASVYRLF